MPGTTTMLAVMREVGVTMSEGDWRDLLVQDASGGVEKCYGIEDWIKDTLANIRIQIIFGLDTCPPLARTPAPGATVSNTPLQCQHQLQMLGES